MAGAIDIFVVGKSQRQSSAVGGGIYGWSLCLPIKRRQAFKRRQPLNGEAIRTIPTAEPQDCCFPASDRRKFPYCRTACR